MVWRKWRLLRPDQMTALVLPFPWGHWAGLGCFIFADAPTLLGQPFTLTAAPCRLWHHCRADRDPPFVFGRFHALSRYCIYNLPVARIQARMMDPDTLTVLPRMRG